MQIKNDYDTVAASISLTYTTNYENEITLY